jgi:selenocysteine lyase/cysteine desulfurase
MSDLENKINKKTRLVAVGYAANSVGTINDINKIVSLAHAVGALVFVDAVHYAPHGSINVHALDCDFLACSAYKFFGPHVGILYGKHEHLTRLTPDKVKPATDEVPSRWETGTLNSEGLAGMVAAINYLAKVGCHVSPRLDTELLMSLMAADKECLTTFHCPSYLSLPERPSHELTSACHSRRAALLTAMSAIQQYEEELSQQLISGLQEIPGVTLYGITQPEDLSGRTPTIALRMQQKSPGAIAKMLGDRGIFSWHGNFYASDLTERLGIEADGGLLRVGMVHYNTAAEIKQFVAALAEI